ncbi:hypothetical protein BIY23_03965 [Wolbachia pipientis]|uniref:Uncharacterized protein n=1 Tax=Wolbachia pipientis TaxID=955 RepID=A0A1E7QJ09_WOLPI|nr:hypothetical protein [Wolbachia pipientis]OEY86445.1 hypothetical protein BIY23_03965 [Wolbachia pipientis]
MVKFLPEETPIAMLWLVKDPAELKSDQLPMPDNERYPYKARLLNWADSEPHRRIRFYYISTGLTLEQEQKLLDLSNPEKGGKSNIEVVDFNTEFQGSYNLDFLKNENIPFVWKIDILRLIPLLKDGPMIYFDFDILPVKNKKIGEIEMNDVGYKMAAYRGSMENSILAVESTNNIIVTAVYNTISDLIDNKELLDIVLSKRRLVANCVHYNHVVNGLHIAAAKYVYENKNEATLEKLEQELKEWIKRNFDTMKMIDNDNSKINLDINEYFSCKGNFDIKNDLSWTGKNQCNLYGNDNGNSEINDIDININDKAQTIDNNEIKRNKGI